LLTAAQDQDIYSISYKRRRHGLHIMRERAEAVGAQVEVDSRPGQGTRVVVRVPRQA
jgi:signal transduction histidine kinase